MRGEYQRADLDFVAILLPRSVFALLLRDVVAVGGLPFLIVVRMKLTPAPHLETLAFLLLGFSERPLFHKPQLSSQRGQYVIEPLKIGHRIH